MMLRHRRPAAILLVLHGLAHTMFGMRLATVLHWWVPGDGWVAALFRWFIPAMLWGAAALGFTVAGLGLLGMPGCTTRWRRALITGIGGSLVLLLTVGRIFALPGIAIDLALLWWLRRHVDPAAEPAPMRRPIRHALARAYVAYLALSIVGYPWHARWGSTHGELLNALPGDADADEPTYLVQHAVTISAPAERVWPWLAQLGGDRAGFYSYARLENLLGLHIENADRVHAEWQERRAGDSVFATPVGWLGTRHALGWRIGLLERERVLTLEGWGAFVLVPHGADTTRLIVRTRGSHPESLPNLLASPLGFLLFEPAHFLMERRMLLGIKERAERPGTA